MAKPLKIVVLAKQVPDTRNVGKDAMKADGTVNRAALEAIFNPEDLNALEQALRLKDKFKETTITILTMGPGRAADIIRESMFRGADDGVLLTDRKFAGADTLATSNALAGALRNIECDMIITGRQAIDGDTAQVGPQIAEHLDLPQVTYVEKLDRLGDGHYSIRKWTEDGYEIVEVEGKVLITVLASACKARYMNVKGIVEAYDKEVEIWGFDNICVEEQCLGLKGSPTRVNKSFTKGVKASGMQYEVSPEEAVDIIMNKLKEKFVI